MHMQPTTPSLSSALVPMSGIGRSVAVPRTDMFVTVGVGGQVLGFPIGKVREIFYVDHIFPVSGAPVHVAGLFNLRGRIVILIDMRTWMGMPPLPTTEGERLCIFVESETDSTGLLVDEVGDILTLEVDRAGPPPSNLYGPWKQICKSVHMLDKGLMLEIDPDPMLAGQKSADMRAYLP